MARRIDNDTLLAVVWEWMKSNYPDLDPCELTIKLRGRDEKIRLPLIPMKAPAVDTSAPFVPTPFQQAILDALDGKALRTDALGAAVGDRARLYRPGGLKELREQGMVEHHERLGFYRPDSPPPDLEE